MTMSVIAQVAICPDSFPRRDQRSDCTTWALRSIYGNSLLTCEKRGCGSEDAARNPANSCLRRIVTQVMVLSTRNQRPGRTRSRRYGNSGEPTPLNLPEQRKVVESLGPRAH